MLVWIGYTPEPTCVMDREASFKQAEQNFLKVILIMWNEKWLEVVVIHVLSINIAEPQNSLVIIFNR